MPLALLSNPVGASETCVATETRTKLTAAAAMKSFMDSASSSGLGAGLSCEYHSCPRYRKSEVAKLLTPRNRAIRTVVHARKRLYLYVRIFAHVEPLVFPN